MAIKSSILVTLLTTSFFSFSQTNECKAKIHEGTFVSTNKNNGDYRIERKKNSQIEYINGDQSKIISKIEWISESVYKITVTKEINIPEEMKNAPKEYLFKIIECDGNYHTLETVFRGETMTFEMRKIE